MRMNQLYLSMLETMIYIFSDFTHGITIDKTSKKIIGIIGSKSGFNLTNKIELPLSKKGDVYLDDIEISDGDGEYYFVTDNFKSDMSIDEGLFMFGDDSEIGIVIEFVKDAFINIVSGFIRTVWFKGFIC